MHNTGMQAYAWLTATGTCTHTYMCTVQVYMSVLYWHMHGIHVLICSDKYTVHAYHGLSLAHYAQVRT
jgi:hypothetical protein